MSKAVEESKGESKGEEPIVPISNTLIQGHATFLPRYFSEHEYLVDTVESLALKKDYPTIFMKIPEAINFHLDKIFFGDAKMASDYFLLKVENSSCSLYQFISNSKAAPFVSQYGISAYAVPKPFSGEIAGALIRHYMTKNSTYTKHQLDQLLENFEISTYHSPLDQTLDKIVALSKENKDDHFVEVIESMTYALNAQNALLQDNPDGKIDDAGLENIRIFLDYANINKKCPLLLLHNISSNQLLSQAMTEIMSLYKDVDSRVPMELFDMIRLFFRFLISYIADYELGIDSYYFGSNTNFTKGCKIDFFKYLLRVKKLDETILDEPRIGVKTSSSSVETSSYDVDLREVEQINAYYDDVLTSAISSSRYLSNPDNKVFLEKIPLLRLLFVEIDGITEMERFIRKYDLDIPTLTVTSITLTKHNDLTQITITPYQLFGSNKIFKTLPLITAADAQMQLNYGDTPLSAAMQPGAKIYGIDQTTNALTSSSVIVKDCGYKKIDGTIFDTQSSELLNNILDLTPENFDLMFPECPMRKKVYLYCRDQIQKRQISSYALFALILHALGENSTNMILIACLPYPTVGIDIDENGNYVFRKSGNEIKEFTFVKDTQDEPLEKRQKMPGGGSSTRKSTRKRRYSKPRQAKSKKHKRKRPTKTKKRRPLTH